MPACLQNDESGTLSGFEKDKTVMIAMSGGVDSSVAACILKEQGYDCVGVMMRLFAEEGSGDVHDAESIAGALDIPFFTADFRDDFKRFVIERFVNDYESGLTPNPCLYCNRFMKFGKLLETAKEKGCGRFATGHYARTEKQGDRYLLKKAADAAKDQSYVLYSLSQEQLKSVIFPLGALSKPQVREIAKEHGFLNFDKPESQDICFVSEEGYAAFIENYTGKRSEPGCFFSEDGRRIGQHGGAIKYTIGQRKGLGLSLGKPGYVYKKDMQKNAVYVGDERLLYSKTLIASDLNWIASGSPPERFRAMAMTRYRKKEQAACVTITDDGRAKIVFDEPQRALTPGQAVVLYDGDYVIGGGIISVG